MNKKEANSKPSQGRMLRHKAERRLHGKPATPIEGMADVGVRALLHELQVHQIELEMQNEELLRVQTAEREVSDKYHNLFDFAPVGYFRLNEKGQILEVNLAGAELLGLDRGRVVGKRFGQFVETGYRASFAELCKGLSSTSVKQTREIKLQRGKRWGYALLEVLLSNDGGMNRSLHITATDITERKQAEEALRQLNESLEQHVAERTAELRQSVGLVRGEQRRFHEVLDALPVYVILLTPDYHVAFANRFFESRFGKSEGRRCYEYLFSRAEPCENCETFKVFKTNGPLDWEWKGPDGRIYDIHDFPFTDVDGSPLIMEVGLDITQRRQDELSLAMQTEEARQQADQLRALAVELLQTEQRERKRLSKILHDHIQQLLVVAQMQVGLLKRDNNVERMHATAQGVDSILREILAASRSLTVELSPPALDMGGLIGGLDWLASRMREKNQFTVNLRADHTAEPSSEETRYLLFECARELLFNAMKHSGVMECHVALLRTMDHHIRLVVRDEGKGFHPDMLEKRRADESTFGLFSIQQRLAHIGGEMVIATAPGKGTNITMTVPVGDAQALAENADGSLGRGAGPHQIHVRAKSILRRVLVVDDHKIMREGLVGLMQFEPDIEVVGQAADGRQAIELAEQLQPDVIIMDVSLGEMSGVEATKCILTRSPNIKVIGLSMYEDPDLANAMRNAGAIAYLTKGGPSEDLLAAIRTV